MRQRSVNDIAASVMAVTGDAVAIYAGFMLAFWVRFESGWLPLPHGYPPLSPYLYAFAFATLLFLLIFHILGLYTRPQSGTFTDKIPRLVRALAWSFLLAVVLAFSVRTEPPLSRLLVAIAVGTVLVLLLIERGFLFRWELARARKRGPRQNVLMLGVDAVAARLQAALERDPRLSSRVVAFLRIGEDDREPPAVDARLIAGDIERLEEILAAERIDQVIVTDMRMPRSDLSEILLTCERSLVECSLVPDMFRVLTSIIDLRMIDGIPLVGGGPWPLDRFGNRTCKRLEDIAGALCGLIFAVPVIVVAAWCIKRESPGPIFYRQERCGQGGKCFTLYKLRTMRADAEQHSGPVWASPEDRRRTRCGAFLRRWSLDELPQFWNVLKGDMSLVGPRPERPHFVEQFRTDISRYMSRHFSKPGMTGWAQVNGWRGQTSIDERIKHDLYYLENWSLAFDFKILLRTFFVRDNAY